MYKYSLVAILLVITLLLTFSTALSGDWVVYVNNKPFNGVISVTKDVAMISLDDLAAMLDLKYEYNELTDYLKINEVVYPGPKVFNQDKLMVSAETVASIIGAKYSMDSKVKTITIQTFNVQLVPTPAVVYATPTPGPQGPKGDEVKVVSGPTKMTEGELYERDKYSLTTVGLKCKVENTCEQKAINVVVTVFVKDGDGAVQDTLVTNIGTLEAGQSQDFDVYFNDYTVHYDPANPAIVFSGIDWQYDTKVDFDLEAPPAEPTPATPVTP